MDTLHHRRISSWDTLRPQPLALDLSTPLCDP